MQVCQCMPMTSKTLLQFMKTMPGWSSVTVGVQKLEDLPEAAKNYIYRIEELTGAPVDVVSTGPDRVENDCLKARFFVV